MKKLVGNKKASHVGMIMSFVIFIVFLIFLYTTLQPTIKTGRDKQVILEYIKKEVISEISANFTTIIVETIKDAVIGNGNPVDCLFVKIPEGVSGWAIVKNKEGGIIDSKIEGDSIKINWNGKNEEFFRIYFSEEPFIQTEFRYTNCVSDESFYSIGSVRKENYPFKTKIIKTAEKYQNDHDEVRKILNIPADTDFSIGGEFEGFKIEIVNPKTNVNVYSDQIPTQYINTTASIKQGFLFVNVW